MDPRPAPSAHDADASRTAELMRLIREEIACSGGAIPFSRFMERALYEPGLGYYEHAAIGRSGDFSTSVSTGPLFGELLARHACKAWTRHGLVDRPGPIHWIEAGAHDGQLALDFLSALRALRPDLAPRVRYVLVEPSATRRAWQEAMLREFEGGVAWAGSIPAFDGVLFSNELLDAFPIERHAWDAANARWWRMGVTEHEGRLVPCRIGLDPAHYAFLGAIPPELLDVLPDGHVVEHSPGAEAWWAAATRSLGTGSLIAFDYGYDASDRFRPGRSNGTLRGYSGHQLVEDVLAAPGLIDLTAHVDFGRIKEVGEAAGLVTTDLGSQHRLLSRWMAEDIASGNGPEAWTPTRLRQWQALSHPAHFGQAFKVLIQERP